jgi:hypothetical protein
MVIEKRKKNAKKKDAFFLSIKDEKNRFSWENSELLFYIRKPNNTFGITGIKLKDIMNAYVDVLSIGKIPFSREIQIEKKNYVDFRTNKPDSTEQQSIIENISQNESHTKLIEMIQQNHSRTILKPIIDEFRSQNAARTLGGKKRKSHKYQKSRNSRKYRKTRRHKNKNKNKI